MQLIQQFKCSGVTRLSQPYRFRFSHRFGGLPGSRRVRSAWSVSGQRSNCGASTPSDAPNPPLSCPDVRPRELRYTPKKRFSTSWCSSSRGEQVGLLSRECAHSSMGCDQAFVGKVRLDVDGLLEIAKLL